MAASPNPMDWCMVSTSGLYGSYNEKASRRADCTASDDLTQLLGPAWERGTDMSAGRRNRLQAYIDSDLGLGVGNFRLVAKLTCRPVPGHRPNPSYHIVSADAKPFEECGTGIIVGEQFWPYPIGSDKFNNAAVKSIAGYGGLDPDRTYVIQALTDTVRLMRIGQEHNELTLQKGCWWALDRGVPFRDQHIDVSGLRTNSSSVIGQMNADISRDLVIDPQWITSDKMRFTTRFIRKGSYMLCGCGQSYQRPDGTHFSKSDTLQFWLPFGADRLCLR